MKGFRLRKNGRYGTIAVFFVRAPLVCLLLLSLGCGAGVNPSLQASLLLDRSTVPLGGPIEVQVQFITLEKFERLEGNYRAVLSFLDGDENLLWEESHDLPRPASTWSSGQIIQYVHRVHVPMYPYIGDVLVAISLYSESSGEAVPLVGANASQWIYRAAELTLEPQEETSFLEYEDGWFPWEFSNDGSDRWRWMGARSVLSFLNPRADVTLVMEFEGRSVLLGANQTLSINSGERVLKQIELDSNERHILKTVIRTEDLGNDDSVRLDLHVAPTFVPADHGDSIDDRRELGIRLLYCFVESLNRTQN